MIGSHRPGLVRVGAVQRVIVAIVVVIVLSIPAPPLLADGYVELQPDGTQRFRPVFVDSGGDKLVSNLDSFTGPALSPDGTRIAFSGAVGDESLGRYALYISNVNGTGLTQLTTGSFGEFDPVWAPDGQTIVFSQNQSGVYLLNSCCRLARVNVSTGVITAITGSIGAVRPDISPDGTTVTYDTPAGVWTISIAGGSAVLRASSGRDAYFSADGSSLAFISVSGGQHRIQVVSLSGGGVSTIYTTTRTVESPVWRGGRIHFIEYNGTGYEGRSGVQLRSVNVSNGGARVHRTFSDDRVGLDLFNNDEFLFYRDDGLFRYYDIDRNGYVPSPLQGGAGYTTGWDSIEGVDIDGDGQDEAFFYRPDGLFRFYHIRPSGSLPTPLLAGTGYTADWDSITAVDINGDGDDEMFFYRADGLYRYYNVRSDGTLPGPLAAGSNYTPGWDSIVAVDIEGDGQDELFFYRSDGLYAFHDVSSAGVLGPPIVSGSDFATDWDQITSVDLDADGQDEMFFYRSNGSFEYREVQPNASLGEVILAGTGYTTGWGVISAIQLDTIPG